MASKRRLAAIMFTDVVGFTAATQTDEASSLARLREQESLLRPLLAPYGGREVKSTGDGFLVEFESALKATECAIEVQRRLQERNSKRTANPIELRIGIHVGDVEENEGDIFGDAVNVASRVVPLAEPGGLCISDAVFGQVRNKISYPMVKLAPTTLKGMQFPMDIYRVVLPGRETAPPSRSNGPSRLAVLPLANISPDPNDEYFADGLTEEIISVLSQIHGLRVIARTSIAQYKATTKSITQVGAELGVDTVLEGSVRKAGTRLRITLQLIDVASQEHTWTESYNRDLDDIFTIQAEIAERTAKALRLELQKPGRKAIAQHPTSNLTAYTVFLRALTFHQHFELDESIRLLEEAVRLDPNFAQAHAALANNLIAAYGDTTSRAVVLPRALESVKRALELAPDGSFAHAARGNYAVQLEGNWTLAEAEFQKAIELNPSDSTAHFWYGLLLKVLQRYDEARNELKTALSLDPLHPTAQMNFFGVCELAGDYDAALETARQMVAQQLIIGHGFLSRAYFLRGEIEDARKEAKLQVEAIDLDRSGDPILRRMKAITQAWAFGDRKGCLTLIAEWRAAPAGTYFSLTVIAGLLTYAGETEEALGLLEREQRQGDRALWFHYQFADYDAIREDPRFVSLLKEIGLPTGSPLRRPRPPSAGAR